MNTALTATAILYIGAGAQVLSRAEAAHYPFWLTSGGITLWVLAAVCATWSFVGSMRERRKWRELNEHVRQIERIPIPPHLRRGMDYRPR